MSSKKWFSVKGVFLHEPQAKNMKQWYEERIILLKAKGRKTALRRAQNEAQSYCKGLDGTQLVKITEVFLLYLEPGDKAEVFSSKTISRLEPEEFLETFYPTTPENCETIGEEHSWHNIDNKKSGCYNCLMVRKGKLWEVGND